MMFANTSKSSARASFSLRPWELHAVSFPLNKMAATNKATTLQAALGSSSCTRRVILSRATKKAALHEIRPLQRGLRCVYNTEEHSLTAASDCLLSTLAQPLISLPPPSPAHQHGALAGCVSWSCQIQGPAGYGGCLLRLEHPPLCVPATRTAISSGVFFLSLQ